MLSSDGLSLASQLLRQILEQSVNLTLNELKDPIALFLAIM